MKKTLTLSLAGLAIMLAGCGSGETQNSPQGSFADQRAARQAARDAKAAANPGQPPPEPAATK